MTDTDQYYGGPLHLKRSLKGTSFEHHPFARGSNIPQSRYCNQLFRWIEDLPSIWRECNRAPLGTLNSWRFQWCLYKNLMRKIWGHHFQLGIETLTGKLSRLIPCFQWGNNGLRHTVQTHYLNQRNCNKNLNRKILKNEWMTAWKVSKYGVISGPYFPVFGLNTDQK